MFIIIYWIPYYMAEIGHPNYSYIAALTIPVSYLVASFTIIILISFVSDSKIPFVTSTMVIIQFITFVGLLLVGN